MAWTAKWPPGRSLNPEASQVRFSSAAGPICGQKRRGGAEEEREIRSIYGIWDQINHVFMHGSTMGLFHIAGWNMFKGLSLDCQCVDYDLESHLLSMLTAAITSGFTLFNFISISLALIVHCVIPDHIHAAFLW